MDDMDGDGVLDLVAGLRFSEIAVLRGLGDGSFSREENYPVVAVGDGHQMALGDFDSDGDVDVVLPVFRQGLTFLPNQSVR